MGGRNLPSSLRHMVKLQRLSFPGCSLGPSMPDWMGDLTQLTFLDLSKNRLRGSLPSTLSTLTYLTTLRLADNLIDSTLHTLQALTNLQSLEIQNNLFKGELDDDFLSTCWSHLVHFNASENQLSGSLPMDLLGHATLRDIDLRYNRFSGSLPSQLLSLNTKLEILALDWNELEGPLPSTVLSDLVAIQTLGISFNLLTGTIPDSMASWRRLQSLSLGNNPFHPGPVPPFLWRMPSLERLHLSNTGLTGTIPKSIGFLSTLRDLDVSWNALTGTLPNEMSRLTNLGECYGGCYNSISIRGTPTSFSSLTQRAFSSTETNYIYMLAWLRIEGNQLSGSVHSICHGWGEEEEASLLMYVASDCEDENRSPPLMGDQQEPSMMNHTEDLLRLSVSASLTCSCCNVCCGRGGKLCL